MLDVTFQGGCILPADDPLWNQSAHCQGAYGHGFRSYVLEWRIYRYARLPSLFIIVVTNKKDHRDRCPQDVQPNQPKTKKSVANTETQCPRSQSGHAMWKEEVPTSLLPRLPGFARGDWECPSLHVPRVVCTSKSHHIMGMFPTPRFHVSTSIRGTFVSIQRVSWRIWSRQKTSPKLLVRCDGFRPVPRLVFWPYQSRWFHTYLSLFDFCELHSLSSFQILYIYTY